MRSTTFLIVLPWPALTRVLLLLTRILALLRTLIQSLMIEKLLMKKIGFAERKGAKKNVNENAQKKKRSARKRRNESRSVSGEKSRANQRRKSGAEIATLAIAQNLAAAIRAAPVAGEMIDRAAVRDDRRRPTRSAPSALFTLTSDMETKSDLARILEHARALRHLDRLVPSALIAAILTVIVDDLALDHPKGRVAEASKNMAPLE